MLCDLQGLLVLLGEMEPRAGKAELGLLEVLDEMVLLEALEEMVNMCKIMF